MAASLVTIGMALVLAQAPGTSREADWLKSVPAETEVVVRVRGLDPVRNDIGRMADAMSPSLAQQIKPALEQGINHLRERAGKDAADLDAPVLFLLRLPKPGATGTPPFAVLARSDNYTAFQKAFAAQGQDVKPKKEDGGFESVMGSDNLPVYTFKGQGFVAASNNEDLMRALAQPKGHLADRLDPAVRDRLLGGDLGIYVDLAAVQQIYGEQIDAARQQLMGGLDQAKDQLGNPQAVETAKSMYGKLFDALKLGKALALHINFAAEGLACSGRVERKTDQVKATNPQTGTAAITAELPDDLAYYFGINADPEFMERFQRWGMSMAMQNLGGGSGDVAKAMNQTLELQKQAGLREMAAGTEFSPQGMRMLSVARYDDPRKAVDAASQMVKVYKDPKVLSQMMVKDAQVEPNAQTYKGFTFTRTRVTLDLDKMAAAQPNNPQFAATMKALVGETSTTWTGTDGKRVLTIVAPDWDKARAKVDQILSGEKTLGKNAGYRAVRAKLPEKVGGLVVLNAQGIVSQAGRMVSAMAPNANVNVPADLPRDPAFLGGTITPTGRGFEFHGYIPSAVGPVFEKGLVPLFQGLQGRVNQ